jgi:hypothetical protein
MIENAAIGKAMGDRDLSNIWNNKRDTINMKLASIAVSVSIFENFIRLLM